MFCFALVYTTFHSDPLSHNWIHLQPEFMWLVEYIRIAIMHTRHLFLVVKPWFKLPQASPAILHFVIHVIFICFINIIRQCLPAKYLLTLTLTLTLTLHLSDRDSHNENHEGNFGLCRYLFIHTSTKRRYDQGHFVCHDCAASFTRHSDIMVGCTWETHMRMKFTVLDWTSSQYHMSEVNPPALVGLRSRI